MHATTQLHVSYTCEGMCTHMCLCSALKRVNKSPRKYIWGASSSKLITSSPIILHHSSTWRSNVAVCSFAIVTVKLKTPLSFNFRGAPAWSGRLENIDITQATSSEYRLSDDHQSLNKWSSSSAQTSFLLFIASNRTPEVKERQHIHLELTRGSELVSLNRRNHNKERIFGLLSPMSRWIWGDSSMCSCCFLSKATSAQEAPTLVTTHVEFWNFPVQGLLLLVEARLPVVLELLARTLLHKCSCPRQIL